MMFVIARSLVFGGGVLCQTWATIPPGPFTPGHGYVVECGADVDALLIDLAPVDPENPADPPQIVSADLDGECGDQAIAFPPGLPAGEYVLCGAVVPCGGCGEREIRPRIIEVE